MIVLLLLRIVLHLLPLKQVVMKLGLSAVGHPVNKGESGLCSPIPGERTQAHVVAATAIHL